jgi:hypothetical protein
LRLRKDFRSRKNSLFYKTEKGGEVGDLFMSLIHTCELNDANPFDYLTELQKHAPELAKNPVAWMPWNYRQALQPAGTPRCDGGMLRLRGGRRLVFPHPRDAGKWMSKSPSQTQSSKR